MDKRQAKKHAITVMLSTAATPGASDWDWWEILFCLNPDDEKDSKTIDKIEDALNELWDELERRAGDVWQITPYRAGEKKERGDG
jgi:hypothetical protein